MLMRKCFLKNRSSNRLGAVAVEFALVLPFLVAIVLGLIEVTRLYDVQNLLETGARDGARLAAMDRNGVIPPGQSTNDKLISDVTNFMASSGVPEENVTVTIRDAANPDEGFDLDDPENDMGLFEILVTVPFSAVSFTPITAGDDFNLTGSIVFRNGRAVISE